MSTDGNMWAAEKNTGVCRPRNCDGDADSGCKARLLVTGFCLLEALEGMMKTTQNCAKGGDFYRPCVTGTLGFFRSLLRVTRADSLVPSKACV